MNSFSKNLILGLICLMFFLKAYGKVNVIDYRGYSDCIKISNNNTTVIISPRTGGRILSYSLNGEDIIYHDSLQDGKTFLDWTLVNFDWCGGRFDYGPEKYVTNRHASTWSGAWDVIQKTNYSVKIVSQPDFLLGIISYREFIISPDNSSLTIKSTMRNFSKEEVGYYFWSRTLVKAGGELYLPIRKNGFYEQKGWGQFIWNPDRIAKDTINKQITVKNDVLRFKGNESQTTKGGADGMEGWMLYKRGEIVFKKEYKCYPTASYKASENMTAIFYANNSFVEIEPVSPLYSLNPGEQAFFEEHWMLRREVDTITIDNIKSKL